MKSILTMLAAGLAAGAIFASHAKLPPTPPKSEEQTKAEAEKAAATKAKDAELLDKAMEKALANARKNGKAGPAAMDGKK